KKVTNRLNLNDRVIFTGYKTKEEMEEYILDSCIFLLTSWSEREDITSFFVQRHCTAPVLNNFFVLSIINNALLR
ncbi:MAG: hypothetical protein II555_05510, partial [Bacteroidales bacterium]|nr:hypothetical protein [Bacteroidales bacterium]